MHLEMCLKRRRARVVCASARNANKEDVPVMIAPEYVYVDVASPDVFRRNASKDVFGWNVTKYVNERIAS
jgi:hypothetical protein